MLRPPQIGGRHFWKGLRMAPGPLEWIALALPSSGVTSDVVAALHTVVDDGTVRILDLVVVQRDSDGSVTTTEFDAGSAASGSAFDGLDGTVWELLSDIDLETVGSGLAENSSALLIVWENLWAAEFAAAVRRAGGVLLAAERIPADLVDVALSDLDPHVEVAR